MSNNQQRVSFCVVRNILAPLPLETGMVKRTVNKWVDSVHNSRKRNKRKGEWSRQIADHQMAANVGGDAGAKRWNGEIKSNFESRFLILTTNNYFYKDNTVLQYCYSFFIVLFFIDHCMLLISHSRSSTPKWIL